MVESKSRFLFEWILYNLIGGLSGICCGFLLFLIIAYAETALMIYFDYFPSDTSFLLIVLLCLISFGLCLGVAQGLKLRVIEIQTRKWGMVTALGWTIAGLVYVLGYLALPDRPSINVFYLASTILVSIGALVISGLQMKLFKQFSSNVGLWFSANVISVVAFQFLILNIWNVLDDFPRNFEWAPILISIGATVLLPIPTGLVLWKLFASVLTNRFTINEN